MGKSTFQAPIVDGRLFDPIAFAVIESAQPRLVLLFKRNGCD
jgi:hypothetical protein